MWSPIHPFKRSTQKFFVTFFCAQDVFPVNKPLWNVNMKHHCWNETKNHAELTIVLVRYSSFIPWVCTFAFRKSYSLITLLVDHTIVNEIDKNQCQHQTSMWISLL